MNDRERFIAYLLGEPVDRPPFWLFWSPWGTTLERWQREGMPAGANSYRVPFAPDQRPMNLPVNCGPCPKIEREVLAEDDDSITFVDSWGIVRRDLKGRTSMSEFIRFPIQSREDWRVFRDRYLDPDHPARLDGDWRELGAEWTAKGAPIQIGGYPDVGFFGGLRWLLGDEECLVAFYTMPDLVHEIMDHLATVYLTVFQQVVTEVRVDVIHLWEDMCGRQGPLISPQHWNEFMGAPYRRIKAFADRHDIPIISVDTDGQPDLIVPCMMDAGVNFLYPMEVAAGCDVNVYRDKYPTLGMMGGIDKRALAIGPQAVERELERIRPAMEKGRYIPDLDHLVPDDVSWDNYCAYARSLRRLVIP